MIAEMKRFFERSANTLVADLAGATALTVIFAVALNLPNLI